jgi:sporulation protein YlmC with PRC-barrel domain
VSGEGQSEPDRVAWVLIEPGWKVVDANGEKVGKVDELLADEQTDIFHGLIVNGKEIDAERIGEIREGEIRLL